MNQLWTFWQNTGVYQLSLEQFIMILIGLLLLYLAIIKQFEPLLLIPIGFGGILSNIPGVDIAVGNGVLAQFSAMGLDTGIFPLLVFMGIGAMTDFGPLLANPKTMLLGAAAQFGVKARRAQIEDATDGQARSKLLTERRTNRTRHVADRRLAIDRGQPQKPVELGEHRVSVLVILAQPVLHRRLVVVGTHRVPAPARLAGAVDRSRWT